MEEFDIGNIFDALKKDKVNKKLEAKRLKEEQELKRQEEERLEKQRQENEKLLRTSKLEETISIYITKIEKIIEENPKEKNSNFVKVQKEAELLFNKDVYYDKIANFEKFKTAFNSLLEIGKNIDKEKARLLAEELQQKKLEREREEEKKRLEEEKKRLEEEREKKEEEKRLKALEVKEKSFPIRMALYFGIAGLIIAILGNTVGLKKADGTDTALSNILFFGPAILGIVVGLISEHKILYTIGGFCLGAFLGAIVCVMIESIGGGIAFTVILAGIGFFVGYKIKKENDW